MVSTGQKLEYLYPAADPLASWIVVSIGSNDPGVITRWNPALGPQPTQAELNALTDQEVLDGIASNKAKAEKTKATQGVDAAATVGATSEQRALLSVALSISNAVNSDREALQALKDAIVAATTLANLKTLVAAINMPAQVTPQQVTAAVKVAIAATPE